VNFRQISSRCLATEVLPNCCTRFFSALTLLVGRQEGHPACKKTERWGVGVVIYLECGTDLHMSQQMPLPLTFSCFSKIHIGFTFLVPAHPGSPGQRAVKRVCVLYTRLQRRRRHSRLRRSTLPRSLHESSFWHQRMCTKRLAIRLSSIRASDSVVGGLVPSTSSSSDRWTG